MHGVMRQAREPGRLNQELEKLKADYQNLFDESPMAMFIVDNPTLKISSVNKAAISKYGYTAKEFQKITLENISHPPAGAESTKKRTAYYTSHYKKNGEVMYVEVKKIETIHTNARSQLITINDVTARVLAEEREAKARQRLDTIFRNSRHAILLADDAGKYVQVNNTACFILGYTEAEFLTLSVSEVVVSMKAAERDEGTWSDFIDTGNKRGIIELKKKSGETIICHYNATSNVLPGLHLSILTDITPRQIAARNINKQLKHIDNIIESITDCFFVVDNNWIVQYWNKAAEQLLQKGREHVIGYNLWDIYKSTSHARFYEEYHKAVQTGLSVHFEEYYPAMDIWLDVSAYPATDGLTVFFRDITNKKKQALETLQARNNQSALINSTSDLIWSVDKELKLLSFNIAYKKRIEQTTGKEAFEGLQLPAAFQHGEKRTKWKQLYQRALRGEAFTVDEEVINPETWEINLAEIGFNPIYSVKGNEITAVACYSRDITERVKNQLLIEEQNEKLKSNKEDLQNLTKKLEKIMNSSLDIICTLDREGRVVQVSEACRSVLGYTPEELTGKFLLDFVDPEYHQLMLDAAMQLLQGNDIPNFQNVYIHKNGTRVTINWSARRDADEKLIFSVGRDVSSQMEAEKQKAIAEQRFTSLVQKGADMVGIIDVEGNYKYASPNIESVLGYTPEYLSQKNALQLIHPDDVHMAHAVLEKVIKGQEAKLAAFRFKNASGEWKWFETIATNQLNNPAINGIVVNSRDITSRKQIETERELMIQELLKSNADLKQFSFITSHNLRAPLSNVRGILNIIDYRDLNDYNRQMIGMLDISAKQLQKTIDDLSNILVIKNNVNIEVGPIDLHGAIAEVKNTFINTLNDVCSHISTDFKVKQIHFNKIYLQSILVNLVSNSIKYRSEKRNLLIKVTSNFDENGHVIFKFSDNGSGIDLSRHKDKLFGLYQRFHDHTEGHGLGLFIIKSQIVALGGKIDVESEPDKGTTFIMTFKSQSVIATDGQDDDGSSKVKHVQSSFSL